MKKYAIEEFRAAAKNGKRPEGVLLRAELGNQPEPVGGRKIRFTFSDGSVDREGDRIDVAGWDLSDFRKNPVALWCHASTEPPIGRASNVAVQGGKLIGDIEFATAETYPAADTIYRLVKGGFVRAVSVGFMPVEWQLSNDRNRPGGLDFKRQKLLEISVVPVPANANALVEARAAGINLTRFRNIARPLSAEAARQSRIIEVRKLRARLRIDGHA